MIQGILLVDDEPDVRTMLHAVLGGLGHAVVCAEGGLDALAQLPAIRDSLRLLITDVEMPGMNGRELARLVCEQCPGTRVLFLSGYMEEDLSSGDAAAFLQKPFTMREFVAKICELTDR